MPRTSVRIYQEPDGRAPLMDWLSDQHVKVRAKCLLAIEQLELHGRELRRPAADFLRDGIYELRIQRQGIQYRLLYGFIGKDVVLLTHGFTKRDRVPPKEIDLALSRLERARNEPGSHLMQ